MTARESVIGWMSAEPSSILDGQTLDNVREASPPTSYTATRSVDIPETQDQADSLDMTVALALR